MTLASQEHQPSVLVVDDQRVNRDILKAVLRRAGYVTTVADSGAEALERLESPPDVVLLDVVMPGMDGFECLHAIRDRFPAVQLPVIMTTGESDRETIVKAFRHGANDYVTKPIDPEILVSRVAIHVQLRRTTQGLRKSEERYALAAQGSNVGLYDWDFRDNVIYFSPRWKEMLGYGDDELPPQPSEWLSRIHEHDIEAFRQLLADGAGSGESRLETEIRMRHRNGSYRWMRCTGIMQRDDQDRSIRLAGSIADVTDGKVRDALTGLPNRLLFDDRLERALSMSSSLLAVLFLDLDNFKLINDSLGHQAGDQLLVSVAKRLEESLHAASAAPLKGGGMVARLGGDEFAILLEDMTSAEQVEQIAERLLTALHHPHQLSDQEVCAPGSIGIAFSDGDSKRPSDLLREADTAMYYAKGDGRGRWRAFDPEMHARASRRMRLERDLRRAVKLDEFYLQYQPIVELKQGRVDRFEALTRWRQPGAETVAPSAFIAVAEEIGLITSLGNWVFEAACRQAVSWRDDHGLPARVAVNVSIREIHSDSFLDCLVDVLDKTGVSPPDVELEVTETTLMNNPSLVRRVLAEVRQLGMRIAVDDFGTGYSSLAYLHRMPLDVLKIDRSFISDMLTCKESCEVVRTIVTLRSLGLELVAEGVETEAHRDALTEIGCTHAQGYLFSRPVNVEQALELLSESEQLSQAAAETQPADPNQSFQIGQS